jgi:hypothetical protein
MKFLLWVASIVITGLVVGFGLRWLATDTPAPATNPPAAPISEIHTPQPATTGYQIGEYVTGTPEGAVYQPSDKIVDGFKEIAWETLMPEDWDPMAPLKKLNLDALDDNDPRAIEALKQAQLIWDKAPVNDSVDGIKVRIPGFVVALEENNNALKEFLLVPYFGACIHTPPPPANQIILAHSNTAVPGVRTMDAVWIHGVLKVGGADTSMGRSGYRMEVVKVSPYET